MTYDQLRDAFLKARKIHRGEACSDDYAQESHSEEIARRIAEEMAQRMAEMERGWAKEKAEMEREWAKEKAEMALMKREMALMKCKMDEMVERVEKKDKVA